MQSSQPAAKRRQRFANWRGHVMADEPQAVAARAAGSRGIHRAGPFLSRAGRAAGSKRAGAGGPGLGPRGSARDDQAAAGDRFSAGRIAARGRARPGDGALAPLLHAVPGVRHPGIGERAAAVRLARRAGNPAPRGRVPGRASRRGREFFSISSSRSAAIGSATTAAWKRSPAIRRSTKRGAIGFASCGGRSAWSIWQT